ncbi:MAG: hypothetical protein ACLQAT_01790 [Candidatus Binataceae bacterium]
MNVQILGYFLGRHYRAIRGSVAELQAGIVQSISSKLICWGCFPENRCKLGPEFIHLLAQLHDRNDLINLTLNLLTPRFLEPLVMILQEMWIRIFLSKLATDIASMAS